MRRGTIREDQLSMNKSSCFHQASLAYPKRRRQLMLCRPQRCLCGSSNLESTGLDPHNHMTITSRPKRAAFASPPPKLSQHHDPHSHRYQTPRLHLPRCRLNPESTIHNHDRDLVALLSTTHTIPRLCASASLSTESTKRKCMSAASILDAPAPYR